MDQLDTLSRQSLLQIAWTYSITVVRGMPDDEVRQAIRAAADTYAKRKTAAAGG